MEETLRFLGIMLTEGEIYGIGKLLHEEDTNLHKISDKCKVSKSIIKEKRGNKYKFIFVFEFSQTTPYTITILEEDLIVQIDLLNADIKRSNFSNKEGINLYIVSEITYPIYFDKSNKNGVKYNKDSYIESLNKKKDYPLYALKEGEYSDNMNIDGTDLDRMEIIGSVEELLIEEQKAVIKHKAKYNLEGFCLAATLFGRFTQSDDFNCNIEEIRYFYITSVSKSAWIGETSKDSFRCHNCNCVSDIGDIQNMIKNNKYICPYCDKPLSKEEIEYIQKIEDLDKK